MLPEEQAETYGTPDKAEAKYKAKLNGGKNVPPMEERERRDRICAIMC
jgi:hypothetical protein